ncbi:MAG TPA: FixH family protein [Polyangia bacterium]|nr:FixH family protein [Polyangia bacterium]
MRKRRIGDGFHRRALAAVAGCAMAAGLGCGGASTPQSAPLIFEGAPAVTVASASGALSVAVWWSPAQPTVGYAAGQLAITDQAGAPVAGATLTVVPWMPAHGHGASVQATITETAPGVYTATPLDFFMSGAWVLRTRIQRSGDGESPVDDTAQPPINIP